MVPVWLKKYLEILTKEKKLGICQSLCSLGEFEQSGGWGPVQPQKDAFNLFIPYATESVDWLVMFNAGHPDLPPDFIFDTEEFLPDLSNLQSLTNWDPRDPWAFSNVIAELYEEYKKYQLSLLPLYPRMMSVYDSIVEVVGEELVEVFFPVPDLKVQQAESIIFIIQIDGPFSKIPIQRFEGVQGEDLLLLKLIYTNASGNVKPAESFCISPRLGQALGVNIAFPILQNANVARYITDVKEFLAERIEMLDNGLSKRQAYIKALMCEFEGAILEVDTNEYHVASILINFLDFHFIVQINIPTYFPKDQPKLTFRSVYHTDDLDVPFSKSSRTYPWSPRWTPQEMIKRLQSYIVEVIPNFQRASVMQGTALTIQSQPPTEHEETYT